MRSYITPVNVYKRTGGFNNELVVAFFSTDGGVYKR